ncbi:MAG: SDR family oxidoreductase [Muribaculaceae bacterium]|nr:SDR family oxidoreductase [Muribaculaceae bacterium]
MMFDLSGRRAVITGAAGDLGKAMAEAVSSQGAAVAILDASPDAARCASEMAQKTGNPVHGIRADLSVREELDRTFSAAAAALGGIDILINCAGINCRAPAEEFRLDDWDRVIDINLRATFQMCQLAAKLMIPQGHGKIINIASLNSFIGGYNNCAYSASKGGVAQLTKTLSNEWAQYGLCVNAIAPGYMRTKMNDYYFTTEEGARLQKVMMSRVPMGRWGQPDDLRGAAVFLASDASDFISGIVLPVDGGFLGR